SRPRRPSPDRPALRRAAELIDRARNPLIFAGNGVIRGKASGELREVAGRTGIPVANTVMAKGRIPWARELPLGASGLRLADALHDWILAELLQGSTDNGFPVKPQRLLHDLRKVLGPDDIVISDVGAHKLWVARLFQAMNPNTVIISNGFASMGIALPGALAA